MTEWIDVTHVKDVLFEIELLGLGAVEVQPGAQFSADGVVGGTPVGINLGLGSGNWKSTEGWTSMESYVSAPFGGTQQMFVRFGLMVRNTAGTKAENGMARLRITLRDTNGEVLSPPPRLVTTAGSTTTEVFVPFTDGVAPERFNEARFSLEISENTGLTTVSVAYQRSWTGGQTWTDHTKLGIFVSPNGFYYGTIFGALVIDDAPLIRWGIVGKNVAGTGTETARVSMKIDTRKV